MKSLMVLIGTNACLNEYDLVFTDSSLDKYIHQLIIKPIINRSGNEYETSERKQKFLVHDILFSIY